MIARGSTHRRHTVVVGAGVVGLAIAWEAGRRGHWVTLVDPAPASGASYAAAGMLAPVSELHYQQERLLELTVPSAAMYRQFTDEVTAGSGCETGYQQNQTLVAGVDATDRQALADLREAQRRLGLQVRELTTRTARQLEPLLGPQISGAFLVPGDHQVDPRALTTALQHAFAARAGNRTVAAAAVGLLRAGADGDADGNSARDGSHDGGADGRSDTDGGARDGIHDGAAVTGVRLDDGTRIDADEVVLANGLGATGLSGLPGGLDMPLRPVYGDIMRLRVPERLQPLARCTIRAVVHGVPVYLVPRGDGTVVLGATQREDGSAAVSAGGVYELLRDGRTLVPAVSELELLETVCRARPATPDNAPLLGRCRTAGGADVAGLIVATGFFRHGVLLAPIAARICADLLDGAAADPGLEPFRPDRFGSSALPAFTSHPHRSES